jgi:hypothetical protein
MQKWPVEIKRTPAGCQLVSDISGGIKIPVNAAGFEIYTAQGRKIFSGNAVSFRNSRLSAMTGKGIFLVKFTR